jgi:hypothetical protein
MVKMAGAKNYKRGGACWDESFSGYGWHQPI